MIQHHSFIKPILFSLFLVFQLWAAKPYQVTELEALYEPWRKLEVRPLEGLIATHIAEGKDGKYWIASKGKLVQYDGFNLKEIPFPKKQNQEDKPNSCSALSTLPSDLPIIIYGKGLFVYQNQNWKSIEHSNLIHPDSQLKNGVDGHVFLNTKEGLFILDQKFNLTPILKVNSSDQILTFTQDQNQDLWLIYQEKKQTPVLLQLLHLQNWDFSKAIHHNIPYTLKKKSNSLIADQQSQLWYKDSMNQNGLLIYSIHDKVWNHIDKETEFDSPHFITRDGTIFVGSQRQLISYKHGQKTIFEAHHINVSSLKKLYLYESSNGYLWIIDRQGQIQIIDRGHNNWRTYKQLHFQFITTQGQEWFITAQGAAISHHNNSWVQHEVKDGIIDQVHALHLTKTGDIIAIGNHQNKAALALFRENKWTLLQHNQSNLRFEDLRLLESDKGHIWLMEADDKSHNTQTLFEYQSSPNLKLISQMKLPDNLPRDISDLQFNAQQNLFIASKGLFHYNPKTNHLHKDPLIPDELINKLHSLKEGLFVSTDTDGIYHKQGDSLTHYTQQKGLASDLITDSLVLSDGTLVIATPKGISRFDGQQWATQVLPSSFKLPFKKGTLKKGLNDALWINYKDHHYLELSEHPQSPSWVSISYQKDTYSPETLITYGKKEIPHGSDVPVHWSGQDYWDKTKNLEFSWRINGGTWSEFLPNSNKTFSNLESGHHLLEVIARDLDFNQDNTPAKLSFTVLPPIWQQAWFLLLIAFFTGTVIFLLWSIIRLREQHLLKVQVERENLLIEMDKYKTNFFSNISHELRTPLTVILGPLQNMLGKESNKEKRHHLNMMLRNANRLSTLITQLLDLQKLNATKLGMNLTQGDMILITKNVFESLQVIAEDKNLNMNLSCPESCHAKFDPDKFEKILTNLINNAIKYTPDHGEIQVKLTQDIDVFNIIVEDTGVGIPKEQLDKIFERFHRSENELNAEGFGIGLDLTKDLVDLWGGQIHVESPLYKSSTNPGTRFKVSLPIHLVQIEENSPKEPSEEFLSREDQQSEVILIIEDDPDIRSFIESGLKKQHQVITSGNGQDGLDLAKEKVPSLVITDWMLPGLEGRDICHALKTTAETSHIPVVMITAKNSMENHVEGLKVGADDYLTKPFLMPILQTRVANLLESRKQLRERFSRNFMLPEPEIPEENLDQEFLEKTLKALEENVTNSNFGPNDLAAKVHMSLSSLHRKIKAITNKTPAKLIYDVRLKMAAQLIKNSEVKITNIAHQVGYLESSHFNRHFKAEFGMTPTQYRQEHS